jgi:hypothetical protein
MSHVMELLACCSHVLLMTLMLRHAVPSSAFCLCLPDELCTATGAKAMAEVGKALVDVCL